MAVEKLLESLSSQSYTQLGIGAVSRNAIDAAIEVANDCERPIMLRVDRRQVDSRRAGRGIVAELDTAALAARVRDRDRGGFVTLCRDHAGPDPRIGDAASSFAEAKISITADLEAGFDLLHVDATRAYCGAATLDEELALQEELLDHIHLEARQMGREILTEVGGLSAAEDLDRFQRFLDRSLRFGVDRDYGLPIFVAAPTGTGVEGMRNIGYLDRPASGALLDPFESVVAEAADLASFSGMYLHAHECDYLRGPALRLLYPLGISAASIGAELGTLETRTLLQLCDATRSAVIRSDFLQLAHASRAWEGMGRLAQRATDLDRAIMSGHHVFGTDEFTSIKERLERRCGAAGVHLDQLLKETLKTRILSVIRDLGAPLVIEPLMAV